MDFFRKVEYKNPKNGETINSRSIDLRWIAEGVSKVNIFFGTSNPPRMVEEKYDRNVYTITGLQANKKYYWKIEPVSDLGIIAMSEVKSFSTAVLPLLSPNSPDPSNNSKEIDIKKSLSWDYTPSEGSTVKYTVLFGDDPNNLNEVAVDIYQNMFTLPILESNKEYFWKVKVLQSDGRKIESDIWSFKTTISPEKPVVITPVESERLNPDSVYFEWTCTQAESESVKYDLYLGTGIPELAFEDYPGKKIIINNLKSDSEYSFEVKAKYENGGVSVSNTRIFITNEVPLTINNIFPENFQENVEFPFNIEWDVNRQIENIEFDIFLSEAERPVFYKTVKNIRSCPVDSLNYDTVYRWYIVAKQDGNEITRSSVYSFKTKGKENTPPVPPYNPVPSDNSLNIPQEVILRWVSYDADGDVLKYDVYFGESESSLSIISENIYDDFKTVNQLKNNTMYFWKVIVKDDKGGITSGPIWNFKTEGTVVPDEPEINYLYPENNSSGLSVNTQLNWMSNNYEYFKIYFGTDVNPNYMGNSSYYSYSPILEEGKTYYWRIVAVKNGKEKSGPVWSFTTKASEDEKDKAARDILRTLEQSTFIQSTSFDASLNNGTIKFASVDLSKIKLPEFFYSIESALRRNEKIIFPLRIRVAGDSLGENFLIGDFTNVDNLKAKLADQKISNITLEEFTNNVNAIKFRFGGVTYTFKII